MKIFQRYFGIKVLKYHLKKIKPFFTVFEIFQENDWSKIPPKNCLLNSTVQICHKSYACHDISSKNFKFHWHSRKCNIHWQISNFPDNSLALKKTFSLTFHWQWTPCKIFPSKDKLLLIQINTWYHYCIV